MSEWFWHAQQVGRQLQTRLTAYTYMGMFWLVALLASTHMRTVQLKVKAHCQAWLEHLLLITILPHAMSVTVMATACCPSYRAANTGQHCWAYY